MQGVPGGAFAPGKEITRAEAVTMLDNSIETYCGEAGTYTGDVEGNVLINASSVILKDAVVKGDIYVMAGSGANADLQGVEATGKIVLLGGGVSLDKASKTAGLVVWSDGAKVDLAKGAFVSLLTVEGEDTTVTGGGSIKAAVINAAGANLAQKPDKVTVASGLTATVAGKTVKGTTGKSSGGGGGSSGGSDPVPEVVDRQRFTAGDPVDIFAPVPNSTDHTHGSGIAALPDGELLTVWFQGNGERDGTTTRIMASRLPKGETEWTEPFVIADAQDIADINPAIYVDSEDRLWMFWYPVLSAMWETSMPMFAYAEPGSYEFAEVGNTAPDWTWSDVIPIKIGLNSSDPVDPETDQFVAAVKDRYDELNAYAYEAPYQPGQGEAAYDPVSGQSIYEDKDVGGGVDPRIYQKQMTAYMGEFLKRLGGDEQQAFAPTVADKVGPDENGKSLRSGYPLLRRIGWQTKNPPLEITVRAGTPLSNDKTAVGGEKRLIVPLYSDGLNFSINAITDDCGRTWKMSGPVVGLGNIQASMAQRENGDIVALMRNNGPVPQRVTYSISIDDGETWSIGKNRTDLFDPGVGHCMAQISGSDWAFISTSIEDGRNVMSIALSENEGKTWPWRRTIELDTRSDVGSYHYASLDADAQGNIYISYTIDYAAGDRAEDGGDLSGLNDIRFLMVTRDWIKEGDWTEEDTSHKAVFAYEVNQLLAALPEDFDRNNKDENGRYAMEEIEKLVAVLPHSIKGYLTYNNHGDDGLDMAAPEYVEIPVTVDPDFLQAKFEVGKTLENVPYVVGELPQGITPEMLPQNAPVLNALVMS